MDMNYCLLTPFSRAMISHLGLIIGPAFLFENDP